MNVGDLLSLLLVVLFVASALFGRGASRPGSGRGRPRPPGVPDTVDEESAPDRPAREAAPRQAGSQGSGGAGSGGGSTRAEELRKRLEEARRRVREAAAGEGEVAPRRPSAERGGTLSGGGTRTDAPVMPAPGGPQGPRRADARERRPTTPADTRRPAPERRPIRSTARAEAERRAARTHARRDPATRSARLSAAELLGTGRQSVVRGYVWSVVLSDPVYLAARRRKVSRRPSP